jgi:hypothetical protein
LNVIKKNVRYVTFTEGEKYEFDSHPYSQFNSPSQNEASTNTSKPTTSANLNESNKQSNKKPSGGARQKANTNGSNANSKGQNNVRFAPNVRFNSNAPGTVGSDHFATNWIECWQAKCAKITLVYDYYPSPVLDWSKDSEKLIL